MLYLPVLDTWRKVVVPIGQRLFDEFVRKPVRGLVEITKGLTLAVPDLTDAVKQAIESKLSSEARARVQEGFDQVVNGWLQLRWPLAVAVLLVTCGWKGLLLAIAVGSLIATA